MKRLTFHRVMPQNATRRPVAYIDSDGDLRIREHPRNPGDNPGVVTLRRSGRILDGLGWEPHTALPDQVFYPGDTLQITFGAGE